MEDTKSHHTCDRIEFLPRLAKLGHPATAAEIATSLQLTERYVQELCNALACFELLTYDAAAASYAVPEATRIVLGSEVNRDTFDGVAQAIHSLHGVADKVADSIKGETKGVPFGAFTGIVEAIKGMNQPAIIAGEIFNWTRPLQQQLEQGIRWVDVGCGSGQFVLQLAQRYADSKFLGIDLSIESIAACQASLDAISPPLTNVTFKAIPIEKLDSVSLGGDIDILSTFDVIHDVPGSSAALKGIYNALKKGGYYFMVEPKVSSNVEDNIGPRGGFIYSISLMHCLTQNLANDGEGLGAGWA
ncbi:S-adenosyl-L-methionine-dependent methyltransferase [Protomyces lactucae-debilis]|uniref:S-adenosyl-L-methionine-dependent methyltransferase n=1 Tax=Protomyces lactucae-debilis TaxID=2754530 RepID=A0A1Y2FUE6_PROLT|nr:S-adenosyl-L-methionine-dependent methyltransferase [Protomyces lactucae-debilis]ORY87641.1 S-adenosyl-L-methionine-dependent methyltransferase [Protomyces lactucae-debilis]